MLRRLTANHVSVAIVLLTLAAFVPNVGNAFVSLDDNYLIYANPAVQNVTWKNIIHVFTSYDPQLYIPLTFLSWQINAALFGMNPAAFHLVNLLLHCVNAVLAFLILRRLSGSLVASAVAATLFAIHPIQTEAVLWAAGRKDLLSGMFFLLSVHVYLRYRENDSGRTHGWSVALFALGLLSKVSVITLPAWLLAIDWLQKRRLDARMFSEKLPYVLFAIIFAVIATIGKARVLGSSGTLLNALLPAKSAVFYLRQFFWPSGLSVIYPYAGRPHDLTAEFAWSFGIIAALAAAALFCLRGRNRMISFGIGTYFLLLAPSFTTFWKNGFLYFASDRYVYLASIGFFAVIGLLAARLKDSIGRKLAGAVFPVLCAAAIAALLPATWAQGKVWSSAEALYRNVLRTYPDSVMARTNLGLELQLVGNHAEAREHYKRAMELDPHSVHAYFNLAALENKEGNRAEAEKLYIAIVDAFGPQQVATASDIKPFLWLIKRLNELGRMRDAERLFEKLQTLAPRQLDEVK
ncbi:glycosyltransferase family 39 protein [Candidatus Peregrinibacteria bacterium]|nr:glycosyltransferase family 39 protein [Candidatus Peregrinibacteria bacterium]